MKLRIGIMTDTETTDTAPTAVILTIGACAFNLDTGEILDQFYVQLDRNQAVELGLTESAATLQWWEKQSDEAKAEAFRPANPQPYGEGIKSYCDWIVALRSRPLFQSAEFSMWANDPDFDLIKLFHSITLCGLLPPWQYWEHKSCRTMELMGSVKGFNKKRDWKRGGTHHNALHDAIYQTGYVCHIWNLFKPAEVPYEPAKENKSNY